VAIVVVVPNMAAHGAASNTGKSGNQKLHVSENFLFLLAG
jgi:hypothetical protein